MGVPRKLWKTEIIVWTEDDPQNMGVSAVVREGESGAGIITRVQSTLVSSPLSDPDAPPEYFFEVDDD